MTAPVSKLRRRHLQREIAELRSKLGAAAGETRKGLRERVARLTKENSELKAQLPSMQAEVDRLLRELREEREAKAADKQAASAPPPPPAS